MNRSEIINEEYFEWLLQLVCENRYEKVSYRKLLVHLHSVGFRYSIARDQSRAKDGEDLRYRFAITQGYEEVVDLVLDDLDGSCSVLEMIVALALRCEECIMDDPSIGNRAGQWFWGMITNLGLGSMTDDKYDEDYVYDVIERFLSRDYEPNGRGGLFTIRNCKYDLRNFEIWYQLCWYLDSIT